MIDRRRPTVPFAHALAGAQGGKRFARPSLIALRLEPFASIFAPPSAPAPPASIRRSAVGRSIKFCFSHRRCKHLIVTRRTMAKAV
jgi:hypothetical protein